MFARVDSKPGEVSNLLLITPDVDFLLRDQLMGNDGVIRYKIFASCVRVSDVSEHSWLLNYCLCWGFEYSKSTGLRIRGWGQSDNDIFIADILPTG